MNKHNVKSRKRPHKIDDIQVTTERLTGCSGPTLFVAYLQGLGSDSYKNSLFKSEIRENLK